MLRRRCYAHHCRCSCLRAEAVGNTTCHSCTADTASRLVRLCHSRRDLPVRLDLLCSECRCCRRLRRHRRPGLRVDVNICQPVRYTAVVVYLSAFFVVLGVVVVVVVVVFVVYGRLPCRIRRLHLRRQHRSRRRRRRTNWTGQVIISSWLVLQLVRVLFECNGPIKTRDDRFFRRQL